MTPEQAAKLRKGDRILVEMVVKSVSGGHVWAAYEEDAPRVDRPVFASAIREVLPRPLEAGDRVKVSPESPEVGQIIAVDGQQAWVRWPLDMRSTEHLSDLQRVEDGQ